MKTCDQKTEVYSRVVGYFRPVRQWNKGKQEEFKQRREFRLDTAELTADTTPTSERDNELLWV